MLLVRRFTISTLFPYTTLFRSRRLSISQALGCFAAKDYFALLPLPAFDNSAMDGYAVVASSCKKGDRKSTRLNSSHVEISYAVFCLKKKTDVFQLTSAHASSSL